jgi:hypothetical protein
MLAFTEAAQSYGPWVVAGIAFICFMAFIDSKGLISGHRPDNIDKP